MFLSLVQITPTSTKHVEHVENRLVLPSGSDLLKVYIPLFKINSNIHLNSYIRLLSTLTLKEVYFHLINADDTSISAVGKSPLIPVRLTVS